MTNSRQNATEEAVGAGISVGKTGAVGKVSVGESPKKIEVRKSKRGRHTRRSMAV